MSLIRNETHAADAEVLGRWRSLDPVFLLVALALSAFGILALYVASEEAGPSYATDQAIGFVVGLAGAIPLALIDYRIWRGTCV
jgi:rod shape determining protein RodA